MVVSSRREGRRTKMRLLTYRKFGDSVKSFSSCSVQNQNGSGSLITNQLVDRSEVASEALEGQWKQLARTIRSRWLEAIDRRTSRRSVERHVTTMPSSDWPKSADVIRANEPRLTIREISVSTSRQQRIALSCL